MSFPGKQPITCQADTHLWLASSRVCLCGRVRSLSLRRQWGLFQVVLAVRLPVVSRWLVDKLR